MAKKARPAKTNAQRYLDQRGLSYAVHQLDLGDGPVDALTVAAKLGVPAEQVFKTLVCKAGQGQLCVAIVPGPAQLDLKRLAAAVGQKSCSLLPSAELKAQVGYVHGGCSPFAMKQQLPTFLDSSAQAFSTIYVSAGQIGLQLELDPRHIQLACPAQLLPLCQESPHG